MITSLFKKYQLQSNIFDDHISRREVLEEFKPILEEQIKFQAIKKLGEDLDEILPINKIQEPSIKKKKI